MIPKGSETALRELRELQKRPRVSSKPVLETKMAPPGALKGAWEPSQPSQICDSVGKSAVGAHPGVPRS